MAERLLQGAFACPSPPRTEKECDTDVTTIVRSSFSGNGTVFQVSSAIRLISDDFCSMPAGETGRELHRNVFIRASYRRLDRAVIESENSGGRLRNVLVLYCRSGVKCVRHQFQQDYFTAEYRSGDEQGDGEHFEFCNDTELENAKAAFDALIAAAPPGRLESTARRVRNSVSGGYINLRKGPSLNDGVIVEIPARENIVVDETSCRAGTDGRTRHPFCMVMWHGQEGWASASVCKRVGVGESKSTRRNPLQTALAR